MSKITKTDFGKLPNGITAQHFTLTNENNMRVGITNFGATITSIFVPNHKGEMGDVVLGYDTLEGYLQDEAYFGCIVGRCANRIANASFELEGQTYTVTPNRAPDHLHGGNEGFNKKLWQVRYVGDDSIMMSYLSNGSEEGYPAHLSAMITYTLTDNNALQIEYIARTDASTICNLTNHTYFNLKDGGTSSILEHELWLNADAFTPMDARSIPTGEIRSVDGTPHDFRVPTAIGARISQPDEQLEVGRGYDHNFVLNAADAHANTMQHAATVHEPTSGRTLEVWTTQPGVQLYTGNYLDGSIHGKSDVSYQHRAGFCLETQHFPDAMHHPHFPSIALHPTEVYRHRTDFRFGVK